MVKIVVIGELCLDRYVYGIVERLSPEAPVPILKPIKIVENSGMAGNVVENLKALSDDVIVNHIHQEKNIVKTRYVESKSNHMFMRLDEGETEKINQIVNLSDTQKDLINKSDITIISDYNKGLISDNVIKEIGKLSQLCVMDSKKKLSYDIIESIDFTKLNEIEYHNNQTIVDTYPEKFVVTLGSKGAKYLDTVYSSNKPQETIDVSGAGDTFISSFILMYYKTNDISKSINFANEVCSDVVSKKGVSLPDDRFKIFF